MLVVPRSMPMTTPVFFTDKGSVSGAGSSSAPGPGKDILNRFRTS